LKGMPRVDSKGRGGTHASAAGCLLQYPVMGGVVMMCGKVRTAYIKQGLQSQHPQHMLMTLPGVRL
jgi:hypothetical protein